MDNSQKIRLASLLSNPNFIIVCSYCQSSNQTPKEALDLIVQEWRESKEIGRLKTTSESSFLDNLGSKVDCVDKLVDKLILKLRRESI